jgi:hypothetical protein
VKEKISTNVLQLIHAAIPIGDRTRTQAVCPAALKVIPAITDYHGFLWTNARLLKDMGDQ